MAAPQITINPAIYYPHWTSDCSTCKAIWHQIADPESAPELNLGTYEQAFSTTCPNHKLLVQGFIDSIRSRGNDFEEYNNGDLGFPKRIKGHHASILQSISEYGHQWRLILINRKEVSNHPGDGRILHKDLADIETVKQWKQRCLDSHGAECQNPYRVSPARPAWLIDVQNQCIVPGGDSGSYVAVSYTYGQHTQPIITSGDFKILQKPFSLQGTEFSTYVSPIIRHAMHLTSSIDEWYLWADALCVTHHDPEAASEQLAAMGIIYANAVVTIIAADGDSVSGMLGLEGWTFQEHELSRRRILFANKKLHWMCGCNILMAGFPDDQRLSNYIGDYNRRSLTFEEDALPAISGLLSVFSRSFEGGFLYGLPEMFFEHSLGWRRPWWHKKGLRRRVISGRPTKNQFAFSDLPSWSWLGWKGHVALRYQTAVRVRSNRIVVSVEGRHRIEEAFPITEWYTSESISDPPERRRRIKSTWFENRDGFKDFTKPMPSGWSRRDVGTATSSRGEPRPYPDGCGRYVFQHEAISEINGTPVEWYYPFPVNEITTATPPSMPDQTQYLFCDTFQATLLGYQQDIDKSKYPNLLEAKLCDKFGKVVGKLDLVNDESRDELPEAVDTTTEIGLQVDVVAICKLKRYIKKELDLPQITKDLYLVL
ncbi:hypothetical protein EDB82DRAFT_542701 [Fusarium venenatum]|uniref:uncharacterized protein n=1 Tax=Fusarium venenatum TaxID=56646 RepID=UPI001D2C932F|nr:hypothetical protein EDB82DRAFT_542701 [Fusarium venenatum]